MRRCLSVMASVQDSTINILCPSAHAFCDSHCATQALTVNSVPTKPFEGQKTGTSGLRKKTEVFTQENYLANWCVWQVSHPR